MLFSLKYFFRELCSHPLQSTMLSLCRASKFQKLSFGLRKCCAKMVLRPQACKAGALKLCFPYRHPPGLTLLAPSIEHLGSIAVHLEGFGEKFIQVGRSGPVGAVGESSIGYSTCCQDTFIEHKLCAEDMSDFTLYQERPTGTIMML